MTLNLNVPFQSSKFPRVAGEFLESAFGNVTKRETLAFKAGGWASLPIDYAIEKYAVPYAKRHYGKKAFYRKISQFGVRDIEKRSKKTVKTRASRKMGSKRSYNESLSKRVAKVEAMARSNRPEMKSITWRTFGTITQGTRNVLDITALAQGTSNSARIGDRIKVWRIEVRGWANNRLDQYIIQCHGTDDPDFNSFGSGSNGFIDEGETAKFTEWLNFKNYNNGISTDCPVRAFLKFPKGINVHYDGSTANPVQNALQLISRNAFTQDNAQDLEVRMWFTDN